jgi:hypothetical protein
MFLIFKKTESKMKNHGKIDLKNHFFVHCATACQKERALFKQQQLECNI